MMSTGETMSTFETDEPLSLMRKYAYGVGALPLQLTTGAISFFLSVFLLEVGQMPAYNLFYVILIGRLWDAVTDPIAGYVVTKCNSRWGKFKPFMLGSLPFLCLSFFALFYYPGFNNNETKLCYYLFVMIIFQTSITFYFIPYGSMSMVLTCDSKERDQLTAYRMVFEIVGFLIGSAYFGTIIGLYKDFDKCKENLTLSEESIRLQQKGYIIATSSCNMLLILCVIITLIGSNEHEVFMNDDIFQFRFYKLILSFKPYLNLMFTYCCSAVGIMLVQANLALFIIHVFKIPKHVSKGILIMILLSIMCIPLGQFVIKKIGKKLTYFSGMVTIIPILISLLLIPANPKLIYFYVMMICSSYPVMVAFLLPWSMLPDCIDYFSITYDIRNEAIMFSLFVFFQKFALGFAVGMTGIILGLANYQNRKCVQPESVEIWLRYFVGIGSLTFYIIAMISLYFYPLNENKTLEVYSAMNRTIQIKRQSMSELKSKTLSYESGLKKRQSMSELKSKTLSYEGVLKKLRSKNSRGNETE